MLDHVEQHGHGGQHPTRLPRLLVVLDALEEGYVGTGFGGGLETPDGLVEAVCLECIRAGNNDNVRSQAARIRCIKVSVSTTALPPRWP